MVSNIDTGVYFTNTGQGVAWELDSIENKLHIMFSQAYADGVLRIKDYTTFSLVDLYGVPINKGIYTTDDGQAVEWNLTNKTLLINTYQVNGFLVTPTGSHDFARSMSEKITKTVSIDIKCTLKITIEEK